MEKTALVLLLPIDPTTFFAGYDATTFPAGYDTPALELSDKDVYQKRSEQHEFRKGEEIFDSCFPFQRWSVGTRIRLGRMR
jgi:hypothetical protein